MPRILIAMIMTVLFTLNAAQADADDSTHPEDGLYIGADLIVNVPEQDLSGDFAEVDPGSGFRLNLGYRFPVPIALEVEFGASGHMVDDEDAGIAFLAINLRYFPLTFSFAGMPAEAFFRAGFGSYALVIDGVRDGSGRRDDLELTGDGFDVGIGIEIYPRPQFSIVFGVTQRFVEYDELDYLDFELIEDVKGSMTTVNAGIKYHF